MNEAAISISCYRFLLWTWVFHSLNTKEYCCWILLQRSYGKSMFIFVGNLQIVSRVVVPFKKVLLLSYFCEHLVLSLSCILAILIGVISVLICNSLNGLRWWTSFHMLICHLYIIFGEVLTPFANFLVCCLFTHCWVLGGVCVFWKTVLFRYSFCQYFLPFCGLTSHPLDSVFRQAEIILIKSRL